MYRTNWGIGHSIREILEAHRGPFTGEGHVGLYEILTTSWHAQLAINLALFGSLSIIVACIYWVTLNPTICWNLPSAQFKAHPQVLKYIFVRIQYILSLKDIFGEQSLVDLFLQNKKYILWENLWGRNNQQETNNVHLLGSSETLRGTFFFHSKNSKKTKENYVYDFSAYKQLKPAHKKPKSLKPEEITFLEWFIGFSEGDGSFFLRENRCVFVINQADALVLNKIRTTLGFGTVQPYKQNNRIFARYRVQGEENIQRILHIFNGNIHLQKVFNRFEKWVNHYNTYTKQPLAIKPRQNAQNITLNSAWIAGFYDAEGGFHASIGEQTTQKGTKTLRLRLNAYVDQQYEKDVMEQIQKLFEIPSVTVRDAEKQHFRVEASTKKTLANILNYFENYTLQGKKHILFAVWKKIALRFVNNTHLGIIESLSDKVEKIKAQNKKFKIEKNAFCFITLPGETMLEL